MNIEGQIKVLNMRLNTQRETIESKERIIDTLNGTIRLQSELIKSMREQLEEQETSELQSQQHSIIPIFIPLRKP